MDLQRHSLTVTKYIYAVIRLTFCFWLGNLPYIFLLFNFFLAENKDEVGTILVTGIILIPAVLAPCLTACFSVARRFFLEDGSEYPLMKTFIDTYKKEYKRSFIMGAGFMLLSVTFFIAYEYYALLLGTKGTFFLILLLLLSYVFLILLNLINDRVLQNWQYIRNAFFLTFRYPFLTVTGLLEMGLVIYICYLLTPSLLIFVTPGLTLLLATFLYRNIMKIETQNQQK